MIEVGYNLSSDDGRTTMLLCIADNVFTKYPLHASPRYDAPYFESVWKSKFYTSFRKIADLDHSYVEFYKKRDDVYGEAVRFVLETEKNHEVTK